MNPGNELHGYGQYLKQVRCEKNISLCRVSQITKISICMLELIEAEAVDKLPEDLYVKSFIRLYARTLGIDEKEAVSRYGGKANALNKNLNKKMALPLVGKRLWQIVIVVLCLVLAFFVWAILTPSDDTQKTSEAEKQPARVPVEDQEKNETAAAAKKYSIYSDEKIKVRPWKLTAKAVEKTWLKVIADGQRPMEYMLDANEEITLEAQTGFDLLIENAAGINLELNGEPVDVPGRSGQVASLRIP